MVRKASKRGARKRKEAEEDMKQKGQSWSIDLIIGVIIFMLVIAVFYAFLNSRSEPEIENLQDEASVVTTKLTEDSGSLTLNILQNGEINQARVDELCRKNYQELKAELGIENDFCIYIEDENGNLIPCSNTKAGIGNGLDISLSSSTMCGASN